MTIKCIKGTVGPAGQTLVVDKEYSFTAAQERQLILAKRAVAVEPPKPKPPAKEPDEAAAGVETGAAGETRETGASRRGRKAKKAE